MADFEHGMLKSVELRLLRCTISSKLPLHSQSPYPNQSKPLPPMIDYLVSAIESGDYEAVLSSEAAKLIFSFANFWEFEDSIISAALFCNKVEKSLNLFLCHGTVEESQVIDTRVVSSLDQRIAAVLCLGIAALLTFIQQNVTGPVGKFSSFPFLFKHSGEDGAVEIGGEWDLFAQNQLTSVGCDLMGKFTFIQHLEYARVILLKLKDFCKAGLFCSLGFAKTTSWWLCRLILLQQRILDDLSSSLYELLKGFKKEVLLQFGEKKSVLDYWGTMLHDNEAQLITSVVQVEAGIIEYQYGRSDSSRLHLKHAAEASGMDFSITGVLGYRTIHQVDAKPQLVLATNTYQQTMGSGSPESFSQVINDSQEMLDLRERAGALDINTIQQGNGVGHYECDILMAPRLIQDASSPKNNGEFAIIGKDVVLTAIQQAIILAQCLHLQRSKRDDELSRWEMAPYIEAINSQQQTSYSVRCSCDMLRIRWESTRSRTKQRSLLMMDKLVEAANESLPVVAQRIHLSFCVYTPTIPALRKEYGELCVGCGMVGEALEIFEDLELWDSLIYCYRLLGKKAAAVDLINARLLETRTDPKLWCSLGDVTSNDNCYEKALEVSNNKSARAMRSLARSAYNRGDYKASKSLWDSALAINSLYPDGWFALGTAALKAKDVDKAIDGFTRAVQLDPENGEAWNNLGCLHMVNKKNKAAFIAFKEALKFRRNSWQLWENYSHVAAAIGNFHQALEAIKMVLNLSSNKQIDIELLDKILTKIEVRVCRPFFPCCATKDQVVCVSHENSNMDSSGDSKNTVPVLEERDKDLLITIIGNVLQQVIKNGGGDEGLWGLYARWHKMKGNLSMCSEALLKQVRAYQGTDLWHNRDRFKKFAQASLHLCEIYVEIASSNGVCRELRAAEMHLKNIVKQAVNFSDTEEFRELQACLHEVRKRIDAYSNLP